MLKKLTTTLLAFTALAITPAFALPVVPEAGISIGVGTKEQYAEAKVLPRTTIGYKRADRDQYGNQNDIYAKYNVIGSNVQLLGGWRNNIDHQSDSTSLYGGIASLRPIFWESSPMPRMSKDPIFLKPRPASTITSPWDGD